MKIELQETTVSPEKDTFGYGASHYRVTVRCIVDDKHMCTNNCVLPAHVVFSDQFDHVLGDMKAELFLDALKRYSTSLVRLTNGR